MRQTLGLDIGGANLKAAHADGSARTVAFPLWKHPERLTAELQRLCAAMPAHDMLAVTLTGELCDCFASKREGVSAILQSVHDMAPALPIRVWTLQQRFVELHEALTDPLSVAAANWLAQAQHVAREFPDERMLLIDAGSTTTDIVYLNRGLPEPRGLTDRERLATGELVYTGVRRTPICAVLGMHVAAEFFATMQDAYLFMDLIPEDPDDCDTADGRPATRAHAHARLARMLCADAETFSPEQARALAERALQKQWRHVARALERVMHDRPLVQRIVPSGSGEALGNAVCLRQSNLAVIPRTLLSERVGPSLSAAACAYAVAILAAQEESEKKHGRFVGDRESRRQSV